MEFTINYVEIKCTNAEPLYRLHNSGHGVARMICEIFALVLMHRLVPITIYQLDTGARVRWCSVGISDGVSGQ